jgi:ABC-2 type transport system ATP-binding protein/nitrous oxidase accessory protein
MIAVAGLSKHFGRFEAVADLSFDVATHRALALWGPNGAGKTTVLKCMLGLLRYQGRITIDGIDLQAGGRRARRLLGYVPQELAFYDDLSVRETARFFARLRRADAGEVAAALEQVGLTPHAQKPVRALSGGMKQRLALALALLGDPPVLVLDEPTSNLDAGGRGQFLRLLREVKAAGKTIMFTSHRLDEVEALADEVLVMEHGRGLFACPATALAARLHLTTQVKLHVPLHQLDTAVAVLNADGFEARRNGSGVFVRVPPDAKAGPIHLLSRADIQVSDFETE